MELELAGRTLSIEVGRVAKQASGAVWVTYGGTVVLVTATMSKEPREGIDFFPLLVDYEERLYAAGKIPGGFIKREGRPSEAAILAARSIDRPLRPLFPDGFRNDVQVVATVLSSDQDNSPEIAAMIGASSALTISQIPFEGPVGAVRMAYVNGEYIINPTVQEQEQSKLNLVVAGTKDAIMMVEAEVNELSEEVVLDAILTAHEEIKKITQFQDSLREKVGQEKVQVNVFQLDPQIQAEVRDFAVEKMVAAIQTVDKLAREDAIDEVSAQVRAHFQELWGEEKYIAQEKHLDLTLEQLVKDEVRRLIAQEAIRPDGRALDEIRPIKCEVGVLPRTHGSGLFTRGQTQVLTVATLGAAGDEQVLDGLGEAESKRYMHHYNFPSYSVGEVRPMRGPGRREIGHGALAERALLPMIPSEEEFPYTIRLVSEVLESNGSSSQASVCGSTLALMDAGVPLKKPVAGIAMGLVKYGDSISILTDIQGMEDHLGDMDFKVAGTRDGITAIQMDIKVSGITREVLEQALNQAKAGRLFILEKMAQAISQPRTELSPYAPRIITMNIDPDKIRDVIGPGGKQIKKISDETGVKIDIEDDGRVFIASVDGESGEKAAQIVRDLVRDVVVGELYLGKVTRIMNFGAFVEVLPGKEGLVHISQLAHERVGKVEDVVQIGDQVMVKVTEIDRQGRINLSRKEAMPREEKDGEASAERNRNRR